MIIIKREANKIEISGHANYQKNNDIVCASVSSIMYTTVNALMHFNKDNIKYSDNGKKVVIEILKDSKENDILINNMISLYIELASKYPKNIEIESEEY